MRPLRLARVAAEAEGLRLRYAARRVAIRAILALLALGFLVGALIFAHVVAWFWLRDRWGGIPVAAMLGGADLLLALILALLAGRSTPSTVELEALAVRRRALESLGSSLALSAVASQLLRFALGWFRRSRS